MAQKKTGKEKLALVGGRLIDGTGKDPVENAVVQMEGNLIKKVGPKAKVKLPKKCQIIDVSGATIIPGLIDCHVHLSMGRFDVLLFQTAIHEHLMMKAIKGVARARRTLEMGFTTVRDEADVGWLACHLRDAIAQGYVEGPRILACGQYIASTGGHGDMVPWWISRNDDVSNIADGVEGVRKAVRRQIRANTDWVKVVVTGVIFDSRAKQEWTQEELDALVDEAHGRERPVSAHAGMAKGTLAAVKAGVDTIEHGTELSDEIIELMIEKGTCLVPTLYAPWAFVRYGLKAGFPPEWVEMAKPVVKPHFDWNRKAWEAGVKIANGSDCGMPTQPHGTNAKELELLAGNGMSTMEAIVTATKNAAAALKLGDKLGTVEKGKLADLVVVKGDPLSDIKILQKKEKIGLVVKDGVVCADRL
ncbi:MAG: amidohydrolase family protein [Deltaproteobacteria bacterium]|nr:amidohydrolase family protein [Deltaproteobacteria bacterium]